MLVGQGDPYLGKSIGCERVGQRTVSGDGSREPLPEGRGERQQYEQQLVWTGRGRPIKRLDIDFDLALRKLQEDATAKGLWKATPAARDRADYWTAGVLAYFDAAGAGFAPNDATRPITTREASRSTTPSCTSWSMRRCYTRITSIGDISTS